MAQPNPDLSKDPDLHRGLLVEFQKLMIETLRLREQEVLRYMAFLVPALGGFFWLLENKSDGCDSIFVAGTIGVLLLLCVGALYSVTLGYNYRNIVLQVAKIRKLCGIRSYVLKSWPGSPKHYEGKYKSWSIMPEVISVFYWSFIVFMAGVLVVAWNHGDFPRCAMVLCIAIILIALFVPFWFGYKLRKTVENEPCWECAGPNGTNNTNNEGDADQEAD